MGSPVEMHRVLYIVHDFFGGVGSPESLKIHRFPYFMISSVEWAAWKPRVFENASISINCSAFRWWSGKRGKPRIIENVCFQHIVHDFFGEVGSVGSPESLEMYRFPNIFHDSCSGAGRVGKPRVIGNA